MILRHPAARLVLFAGTVLAALASHASAAPRCSAPAEMDGTPAALPHTAAALKPGGTLDVLTIGSATVFNPTESLQPGTVTGQALGLGSGPRTGQLSAPADTAFPQQMAKALEAAVPGLAVHVTVKGGRGLTAADMLEILQQELPSHHYQLVLWQTGTVEAVHNTPATAFYQTLSDGAALVTEAGADLVLIDPQFSRFLRANSDVDSYNQALQQLAGQPDVALFHRFDLMRYWAGEGAIDLEHTPKAKRVETVEALHACLGVHLAHFIEVGARTGS